jgi:sugar phosphate isomerase/epimerase
MDEIKAVAALGFDYLELCLDPPNGLPGLLQPRSAEVKSILAGVGLGLPVVHLPTFVALADIYPSIREASSRRYSKHWIWRRIWERKRPCSIRDT